MGLPGVDHTSGGGGGGNTTYGLSHAARCSRTLIRWLRSAGAVPLTARLCRKPISIMVCWYARTAAAAGLPATRLAYARADIRSESRAIQRISSGLTQPICDT